MQSTQSKDGTTLAYDVYGSGPALIYVTGAICFRKFGPIVKDAKVFARAFTVYSYDRRGRGDSSDTLPYTLAKEVEDIEALIDAAGGSAVLYGHSSGAVLALESALCLPQKVKRIVLFDAPYVYDQEEKKKYALLRRSVLNYLEAGKNARALKTFLTGIGMPKPFVFLLPLFPGWTIMKALAPTLAYDMQITSEPPPLDRLKEIKVPTHVIYGGKSPHEIHEVAKQISKAIPRAKLTEVPGQDHMINAKVLLPLLDEC